MLEISIVTYAMVSIGFLVYRWLYYVKVDSAAHQKVICDTDSTEVRAE